MDIYYKYIITGKKKKPSMIERALLKTEENFEIWSPGIINGFRDKINTEIWDILSITPTEGKMEVF